MQWQWQKGNKLTYLTIPKWSQLGVEIAFSSRHGGISANPYASLNLGLHVGDEPEKVIKNREIFLSEFGLSLQSCILPQQVHGIKVSEVSNKELGLGMGEQSSAIPSCDGLITKEQIGLLSLYADCVPLYFYSPKAEIVGLAHAGWKGTANQIVNNVLTQIKQAGGASADCHVAIGPCIGPCCYEVGEDVAAYFLRGDFSVKNENSPILKQIGDRKYQLDLAKANYNLLLKAGVKAENISLANLCTACNPELFFSYRRDGNTGRMASFIVKHGRN